MNSAGPWSVKGIDPKAREIAKDLARRSGMTLGEWLNQVIIEGEPEAPPLPPLEALRRAAPALSGAEPGPSHRFDPFPRSSERGLDSYRDRFEARQPERPTPERPAYEPRPRTDDAELARVTQALEALSGRIETAEHRSTLAISGIDQSVMGVLSRLDGLERDQTSIGARFDGALDEVREAHARLGERVRRMEQEDGPRVEAMKALEAALGKVAAQIYESEGRARTGLDEVRQDVSGLARRLDKAEQTTGEAVENYADAAMVEAALTRMADRLEQSETRTAAAARALEASFASLDARIRTTESRLDPNAEPLERRFERLAADLSQKVEASRTQMAEQLRAAADGKLDGMETALRDLAGQVQTSEQQSAQAIDRMGQEVVRIAQSLGGRVSAVERRGADAVQQVGGEMARIAEAMESRMRSADTAQAEALEKLGGEIGRIAERLAQRIASSERANAQAVDEVGDKVARVTEKINQRYDRAATELSDRIRQSEERTAKLLEETRDKLDQRLAEAQRRGALAAALQAAEAAADPEPPQPPPPAPTVLATPEPEPAAQASAASPFADDPFGGAAWQEPPPAPRFEAMPEPAAFAPSFPPAPEPHAFAEPLPAEPAMADHASAFAPEPPVLHPPQSAFGAAPGSGAYDAGAYEDFGRASEVSRSSTRDLIEAARMAARQASAPDGKARRGRSRDDFEPLHGAVPAPAYEEEAPPRGLAGFRIGRRKKKEGGAMLRTALLASGTAATLSMAAAGYGLLYAAHPASSKPSPVTAHALQASAPAAGSGDDGAAEVLATAVSPDADAPDSPAAPVRGSEQKVESPAGRHADAKPVQVATSAADSVAPAPAETQSAKALYAAAVRQIEAGDSSGVEALRRGANLGYAPAQFYLAKLFETGASGVKKDPAEARRWTERAATSGDPKAMHNLALYYFEGTGGAKNAGVAATWFRRAAEAGLEDSQYNLARLYEQGYGVTQNPAEAYKWYLVAAAAGDPEAKTSAERLRPQLSADVQSTAVRSASAFRPQAGGALAANR